MPSITKIYPYLIAVIGTAALAVYFASPCSDIPEMKKAEVNHGYRIWSGQDLKTFEHRGKTCVPKGWLAVGATKTGDGWARFPDGKTGIVIREDMFTGETLTFENDSPRVQLLYSVSASSAEIESYTALVRHAFEKIGSLYDARHGRDTHTVLVTSNLRNMIGLPEQVYPDPTENVTILAYPVGHARSEELFIHAVMHLFNRQYANVTDYQKQQFPIPAGDFSELEATWTETAFRTSDEGRMARLRYLYTVHTAVQTKNVALITEEPFTNRDEFEKIRPTVAVPEDGTYLDFQYGHYILAPLAMVATEGLLIQHESDKTIESILRDIHLGDAKNFFAALQESLPEGAAGVVTDWMLNGKTIPWELVELGASAY